MIILFILAIIIGMYEGLREVSLVRNGLLAGVKPAKNLMGYLMNE